MVFKTEEERKAYNREKTRRWRLNHREEYLAADRKAQKERYYTIDGRAICINNRCNTMDRAAGRPRGDLTTEWTKEQIIKGCTHCDEKDWRKIGLNRKDNSLPHTQENCEPCCKRCNDKLCGEYNKERYSTQVDQIIPSTGEVIKTWNCIKDAAKELGYNSSNISKASNGGYFDKSRGKWHTMNQYKGYIWKKRALPL